MGDTTDLRTRTGRGDRRSAWIAAIVVAFLAVASSASAGADGSPRASQNPSTGGSLEATVGRVVTDYMTDNGIPGVIVYVQSPSRGTLRAAYGVADTESDRRMDFADRVRIGSITKTMTATVIMQLAQEGKLDLDEPLAGYFPGIDTNEATIRQALRLTSGIPNYTTAAFLNALADDPARVWSHDEIIAQVSSVAPSFPAGTDWEYSNTNYVMLGVVAEMASGESLTQLFDRRIFTPLEMDGCSVPAAGDAVISAPRSQGYQLGTTWDREKTPPAPLPAIVDVTDIDPSWAFGTGHVICTAADLAAWATALATGELLSPAMQEERLDWYTTNEDPLIQYGLGISNLLGLVGHNGEISGYQSQASYRQADGTVIVVLTNLMITPDLSEPATVLAQLISEALPA